MFHSTQNAEVNRTFNSELRWTTNHRNPAVLRLERAPPLTCPSPNRPRYQTCVWMDPLCMNVWTQCWGARFISSDEKQTAPTTGHHPLPPLVGRGQESGGECRMCERASGRMSCVCLACVRDWEVCKAGWERMRRMWGRAREREREREKKITTNLTSEEKQKLRNATMRLAKVSGVKFCLWKRGWSSNPWKEELWIWKKNRHHKDFFVFLI